MSPLVRLSLLLLLLPEVRLSGFENPWWHPSGMRIVGPPIGTGVNGEVREVSFRDISKTFALKTISKKRIAKLMDGEANLSSEIGTHGEAKHPNIVELHVAYEHQDNVYLLTEFCAGGDLFEALKSSPTLDFDEFKTKQIAWYIALGIKYLHDKQIVHRDLKLENIFLTSEGIPKIGDFGAAKKLIDNQLFIGFGGTTTYLAPEIWDNLPQSFPVDIWAFGVMIYIMLHGYFPFDHQNTEYLRQLVLSGEFEFDGTTPITDGAKSLLRHMLTVPVKARFTIDQVIAHSWFDDIRREQLRSESLEGDTADDSKQARKGSPREQPVVST